MPRWIYKLPLRLRSVFNKGRVESDLSDELRFHLEKQIEQNIASGMSAGEARYAALREFGGVEQIKEQCRDSWGVRFINELLQDLRYGLRQLSRNPGFTIMAIVTLALGIGTNTAIFSAVNGILLQPLQFSQPNRLVAVTDSYPQGALVAMRANLHSIEVAGYRSGQEQNLTGVGNPIRLDGTAVSANFFSVLGVHPEFGRTFLPAEDQPGNDRVVILSYELWQKEFHGDPSVIGRVVSLGGEDRQIVGVMPGDFHFGPSQAQFWVPLHLDPRAIGAYWGGGFMPVIGRLRPGAALDQARAELRAYIPRMRQMFPWQMPNVLWAASTVIPLQEGLVGGVSEELLLLLGATGLILLIACANVANLLLARAATRQREMAMRSALGAGRWRIFRQLLTESLTLAMGSGALGILLAKGGILGLKGILPANTPRLHSVAIDWRVLVFAIAAAILTGLIFGIAPALHASRLDLTKSLKTRRQRSTAGSRQLRGMLTVTEVALAFVVVTLAGLTARSLWELLHVNPGFQTESILTARLSPNESFCKDFVRCRNFYDNVLEQARALPGVEGAAAVNVLPLGGRVSAFSADIEDRPSPPGSPALAIFDTIITPGYLRVMGIPLLRGRSFTVADMSPEAPPVALVTQSTAKELWPNEDPIGKHIRRVSGRSRWVTVIGVVGDVNEYSLASRLPGYADGAIYEPYGGGVNSGAPRPAEMSVVMRMRGSPPNIAQDLRNIVAGLSPNIPVTKVRTVHEVVSESATAPRSTTLLFAIFAALALALGTVGVYGVISYWVTERTPDIGIRMALGAEKRDVLGMVMRQGLKLALIGVGIGIAGALALTRFLASLLYGVRPTDPLTFIAVSLILIAVALMACYLPARRAAKVDPIVALRYE